MGARVDRSGLRYVIQQIALFLMFAVILFVSAGTLHWMRAWIYLAYVLFLESSSLIVVAIQAPETLRHRGERHAGVKTFDKVLMVCWLFLAFITPIVTGLDMRFGWSHMPTATICCGVVIMGLVYPLGAWAMVENEHFERFVRIQTDRIHQVVTTGPYRIVRHPAYAGAIVCCHLRLRRTGNRRVTSSAFTSTHT